MMLEGPSQLLMKRVEWKVNTKKALFAVNVNKRQ